MSPANILESYLGTDDLDDTIPNEHPTFNTDYKLAIIGDAPGREEEAAKKPFVGASGRLLWGIAGSAGIARGSVLIANVCQIRPPSNDISRLPWTGPEIEEGLKQLKIDLDRFDPNCCILLGAYALKAATLDKKPKIKDQRGYLFMGHPDSIFAGRKCLATYHPSSCLRMYENAPIMQFDMKRAYNEAKFPELNVPKRKLITDYTAIQIVTALNNLRTNANPVSLDIEGGINSMSCISFSDYSDFAFIVPFKGMTGRYWSEDEEVIIWEAMSKLLADPHVPKILQNSLYDNFVLAYSYKCPIVNVADDTMLKHWEAYCELPKGLGFQAALYTREPHYKFERKTQNLRVFWEYCCKDSAVTYEINKKCENQVPSMKHYKFNIAMLNPLLYMELRGIKYATTAAVDRQAGISERRDLCQTILNLHAGKEVNVNSPKFKTLLYTEMGLPAQINRATGKPTANEESLIKLFKRFKHPVIDAAMQIRKLGTRARMLSIHADEDGRIRCGYNIVGTETGRLTCYTSPTGSGYNLQTIPKHDRDLFIADDEYWFFQCDLAGADGWTVAAHCQRLGDPTMMDDLLAGIKIPLVIACLFKFGPTCLDNMDRVQIKEFVSRVSKKDPIYHGSKGCQHGSNYGMGKVTMSANIFKQTGGTVNVPAADCEKLQRIYFMRYWGVPRWHQWVRRQLNDTGILTSASGHVRRFFGRKQDHSTLKAALSHEPQANTTYATNMAALNLWNDPENRRPDGSLIIEPLHQVHDALCGQFPKSLTKWAAQRLTGYFANQIVIADQQLTIPFEGEFGRSWGEMDQEI